MVKEKQFIIRRPSIHSSKSTKQSPRGGEDYNPYPEIGIAGSSVPMGKLFPLKPVQSHVLLPSEIYSKRKSPLKGSRYRAKR